MTSPILWMRAGVAGIALCAAAPALAQDIRNIPQKTDTTVTGPVAQPKVQGKQGGAVQGPPAPLETQLRDTPPDDIIVPQQTQPRPQAQPQPVQVRPTQPQVGTVTPRQQTRTAPSGQTPTQSVPGQAAPSTRAPTAAATAAPSSSASASPANGDQPVASPAADTPSPVEPGAQANPESSYLPTMGSSTSGLALAEAAPGEQGPKWPWVLGGLLIVGLGGAFLMRRRPATAGGFELGQTPWRDELDKDAPLPGTTVAKPVGRHLPDVKIPQAPRLAPVQRTAPPVAAPPPAPQPEPAKAAVNESGLIVSRVRRPVEMEPGGSVMAEPMQAPPPAPPPPQPAEARVANDGRIVSGRRASEFGAPPPEPKRKRPRKELPGGGMSFGYKVQR